MVGGNSAGPVSGTGSAAQSPLNRPGTVVAGEAFRSSQWLDGRAAPEPVLCQGRFSGGAALSIALHFPAPICA